MQFNDHSRLVGKHAILSASKHSWINYDRDHFIEIYSKWQAAERGTKLHDLAERLIRLRIPLPENGETLNMYVNDALRLNMQPEQVLYYSSNCFGTADAISFSHGHLQIHDLKTGVRPASMDQLKIYAALFCLEYDVNPNDISMELRIYQNNDVVGYIPEPEEIIFCKGQIIDFDALIKEINNRMEE